MPASSPRLCLAAGPKPQLLLVSGGGCWERRGAWAYRHAPARAALPRTEERLEGVCGAGVKCGTVCDGDTLLLPSHSKSHTQTDVSHMRDALELAGTRFFCRLVDLCAPRPPHSDTAQPSWRRYGTAHCWDLEARAGLGVGVPAPFLALTFQGVCLKG